MIKIIPDREGVLTQWDLNRKVLISGIDNLDKAGIEVHFASPNDDHNAYVVSPVINNNIVSATIPNILLTIPGRIYVYVYTSYTQDKAIVAVAPREKPDDYVYTETEKFALEQWEKEVTEKLEGRYDKAVQEIDERYAGLRDDAITASAAAASAQTSAAAADLSATRAEAAETNAKENAKAISEVGDQVTANAKAVSDALIIVENAKSDALAAKSAAEAANEKAASSANAAKESQTAAETAESNAAEAAKAAQQAETSATEAKDNAITAKDDAENAKGIAETAKDDAIVAKNAAEQAKTAAETAAENVPIIDDTLAAGNRTWSSQNIIEKLCPPLMGSGNPVVVSDCIEGYPMKVVASWEPTQAGSGDPSPENIRAISGRESIAFDRCGANLLDVPKTLQITGVLTISKKLPPGPYKLSWGEATNGGKKPIAFVCSTRKTAPTAINFTSANRDVSFTLSESIETIYIYSNGYDFSGSAGITSVVCDLMLSADKSATYAPYSGTTRNLTLPETVYGGSVDATTGEGLKTWDYIASYAGESLPGEWISDRDAYAAGTVPTIGAAVAYRLAEPVPFTATGGSPLYQLDGINTVISDADTLTVNGRADPIKVMESQRQAIISLGGNI